MPDRIYVILMASGFSRRFGGENKLLVPFRGKALARHTLDLACGLAAGRDSCHIERIFFITADDAVAALARDLPVIVVRNTRPELGQRESIRLGVKAARSAEAEAAPFFPGYYLFCPCDQPFLDDAALRRILGARKPGHIVQPVCRGEPGNPALFSDAFGEDLLHLGPGERGRDIIKRYPEKVIRADIPPLPASAPFPNLSPLADIDESGTLAKYLAG
jgi:molybdenum cofactor cytidylyltransferase